MTEVFIFRTAFFEYLRFRRLWIWLALSLAAFLIASSWRDRGGNADEVYTQVCEAMVFKVMALASAIFTTSVINQEVEQKTIAYILTRPLDRWRILLSRYLATVAVVSVLGFFGLVAVALGAFGSGWLSAPLLGKDMVVVVFGAAAYGALFLFASLLVNRAMLLCLLFAFGWETIVPNMPGEMYYLSILTHMKAMAEHPPTEANGPLGLLAGALGQSAVSSGTATAVLTLMTIALVAISCWWFSSFEYVPREDAE